MVGAHPSAITSPTSTASATSDASPDGTGAGLVASPERSPGSSTPAQIEDVADVHARLVVLTGRRDRMALRMRSEREADVAFERLTGRDVVAETSDVVASWTAAARSTSPVLASERVRVLAALAEIVAAAQAALVAVVEGSAQHAVEGAPSAVAWLTAETGVSAGAAKRTVSVGRLVERFDATRDAVESGMVSIPKAEVLASAVLSKGRWQIYERDEAVLVEAARTLPTAELSKVVRRWVDLADDDLGTGEPEAALARRGVSFARLASGNLRIAGELDEAGAAFVEAAWTAFDRPDPVDDETCPPRTVAQRRADFLVALAARALSESNGAAGGPVATVDVIVDLERLAAAVPALVAGPADGQGHDPDPTHSHHQGSERREGACRGSDPGLGRAPTSRNLDPTASEPPGTGPPPRDPPDTDPLATDPLSLEPSRVEPGGARPSSAAPRADDPLRRGTTPTLAELLAAVRSDPRGWCDAIGVGPIASHVLAQVTCDCWIGRNVMAGPSATLDLGRRQRTFTADQRRAIVARDRHCTHPRCTRPPEWCQIHHVDDWDHDGPTDIANGTLRCTWHHTWHHVQERQRRLRRTIADATR